MSLKIRHIVSKFADMKRLQHISISPLKWLQATVKRNGGRIQEEWLDSEHISGGCFGKEI